MRILDKLIPGIAYPRMVGALANSLRDPVALEERLSQFRGLDFEALQRRVEELTRVLPVREMQAIAHAGMPVFSQTPSLEEYDQPLGVRIVIRRGGTLFGKEPRFVAIHVSGMNRTVLLSYRTPQQDLSLRVYNESQIGKRKKTVDVGIAYSNGEWRAVAPRKKLRLPLRRGASQQIV